jgi:hypothetical protein
VLLAGPMGQNKAPFLLSRVDQVPNALGALPFTHF